MCAKKIKKINMYAVSLIEVEILKLQQIVANHNLEKKILIQESHYPITEYKDNTPHAGGLTYSDKQIKKFKQIIPNLIKSRDLLLGKQYMIEEILKTPEMSENDE